MPATSTVKYPNVEQMGLHVTSCGEDMLPLRRCLAASFFLNAALKQPDNTYRALSSGLVVKIHPSSVLFRMKPECIIFNELVRTNQNYVRNVSTIDYLWLPELAPQCYAFQKASPWLYEILCKGENANVSSCLCT